MSNFPDSPHQMPFGFIDFTILVDSNLTLRPLSNYGPESPLSLLSSDSRHTQPGSGAPEISRSLPTTDMEAKCLSLFFFCAFHSDVESGTVCGARFTKSPSCQSDQKTLYLIHLHTGLSPDSLLVVVPLPLCSAHPNVQLRLQPAPHRFNFHHQRR